MIKQLKQLENSYLELQKAAVYMPISQIIYDLRCLIQAEQIKRNIRGGGMMPRT